MPRAVIVLAEGFEEIEAITPIDVLRRAGVEVVTAGVGGRRVVGSHGIAVEADATVGEVPEDVDVVVLPGGLPGAENLGKSPEVRALVERVHAAGRRVAAICAAPAVALAGTGVLRGRRATCYPGFEERFGADVTRSEERVVVDGTVVTSRGPGTALEFSLALVEQLVSREKAEQLRRGMLV
ncbi:MAG: DJ-1/PfpI family protein [Planctomycetes bacterium]|nr:DJ-1/PfpI family protein [Planctomycetota bacterium]